MSQPTFTAIRQAYADFLAGKIPGLRASANRVAQVNPPQALVVPESGGTLVSYQVSMDGAAVFRVRVIVFAAMGDSTFGEAVLDPYLATDGPQSVWAAVRSDPTLGGLAVDAAVLEVASYGVMNVSGVDFLAAHFITEIYV